MKLSLFQRRPAPNYYPGSDTTQEPGRMRMDGASKRAIETGRTRLIMTGALFLIGFSVISLRMIDLTIMAGSDREPRSRTGAANGLAMDRADIVDRNGVLLATSLPTVSLYANPLEIIDADEAAARLVRVLPELSHAELVSRLSGDRSFVYLRRHLTPRQQQEVNDLGIPGVYFEESERRIYPQGPLMSHVVGLTDWDNKGIAGIEKTFDAQLRDSRQPLRLAIDLRVQSAMRNELARAVQEFRAIGGTGMVIDVRTGEMLAMVSLPDFDPNAPGTTTSEAMFNRATLGVYEMGSTFKLFNTAMALDTGKASMSSGYDASKPIRVARFTISDYHAKNRWLSVPEILIYSSNIGSAKMALDVGTELQRAYMGRFGMLRTAAIELPEVGAPLVPSPWREINTMTISYGHGIAVTPLQLATGVASLVNGGLYLQPTLIKREPGAEVPKQRILKPQTSESMRKLMRMVVEEGTGGKADVAGYLVGGKTGTAEKLGASGGYRKKALLSSFVAAFPMNDPRYVVVAMVDEPQGTKETFGYATGGWTAAPVVGRVIAQIGPMLGVQPVITPDPAVQVVKHAVAKGADIAEVE